MHEYLEENHQGCDDPGCFVCGAESSSAQGRRRTASMLSPFSDCATPSRAREPPSGRSASLAAATSSSLDRRWRIKKSAAAGSGFKNTHKWAGGSEPGPDHRQVSANLQPGNWPPYLPSPIIAPLLDSEGLKARFTQCANDNETPIFKGRAHG